MQGVKRVSDGLLELLERVRAIPREEEGSEEHVILDEKVANLIGSEGLPGPADRTVVPLNPGDWELAVRGERDRMPTVLGTCAMWHLPRSCEELLRQGASVEVGAVVWHGGACVSDQPLYRAVPYSLEKGLEAGRERVSEETVRVLLEAGADPNPQDDSQVCALGAVDVRARGVLKRLLQYGGDPLRCALMLYARPREKEEEREQRQWERLERSLERTGQGEGRAEWLLQERRRLWEARWWASRELLKAVGWERLKASERPLLRCLWKAGKRRYRREVGVYQWARYWGQLPASKAVLMVRGEVGEVLQAVSEALADVLHREAQRMRRVQEELGWEWGENPTAAGGDVDDVKFGGLEQDAGGRVLRDGVVGLVALKLRGSEWVQVFRPSHRWGEADVTEEVAVAVSRQSRGEVLWLNPAEVVLWQGGEEVEREAAPGRGVPRYWQAKRWKEPGRVLGERGVEVVAADQWHNGFWQEVRVYGVSEEEVERVDVLLEERLVPLQEL